MKSIIQKLAFRWDIFTDRFEFLIAKEKSDVEACIAVLEEVRRKELNRVSGATVLDSHAFSGEDLKYILVACRDTDTGKIIGCMRITDAFQAKSVASSKKEYHLDLFPEDLLKELRIITRLAVLKPYRKTPAALVLMVHGFNTILKEGGHAVLMSCEPNLFTMYKRLGLRPIGQPHNSPSGGFRIPMIFMPDLNYMKEVNSPALLWANEIDFSDYPPIKNWYQNLIKANGAIQLGASQFKDEDENDHVDKVVTDGLSKASRKAFIKNAMVIHCKAEDLVIAKNDGGKAFGIVKKGLVKVVIDDRVIGLLGKGDVFGEIAFVLNRNRSASLIAVDDNTEVILFSVSAIKRLREEEDKVIVWQNLAKVLAGRLIQRTNNG